MLKLLLTITNVIIHQNADKIRKDNSCTAYIHLTRLCLCTVCTDHQKATCKV